MFHLGGQQELVVAWTQIQDADLYLQLSVKYCIMVCFELFCQTDT
jgi:hypothetical protein